MALVSVLRVSAFGGGVEAALRPKERCSGWAKRSGNRTSGTSRAVRRSDGDRGHRGRESRNACGHSGRLQLLGLP